MLKFVTTVALTVTALCVGMVVFAGSIAYSAPFTLSSIGIWQSAAPDPLGNPNTLNGLGTNDLRWGIPVPSDAQQSGYVFVGVNNVVPTEVDLLTGSHVVGALVHNNFPIESNPGAITAATLAFTLSVNGNPFASILNFAHAETDNQANPCAILGGSPPAGGCRDVVTLPSATQTTQMLIDGVLYDVALSGFLQNGVEVTQFITNEMDDNSAGLLARFARVAVPEPLTLMLFGLGLLFIGWRTSSAVRADALA